MRTDYRVAWQREGNVSPRSRRCGNSIAKARRCLAFVEGRYSEAYPNSKQEGYVCCSGWECGCGGKTWADRWAELAENAADMGRLLYVRIEARQTSPWKPTEEAPRA